MFNVGTARLTYVVTAKANGKAKGKAKSESKLRAGVRQIFLVPGTSGRDLKRECTNKVPWYKKYLTNSGP